MADFSKYEGLLAGEGELRIQENRGTDIRLLNGNIVANASSSGGGTSARAYRDGCWGFASAPETGAAAAKSVINAAAENAQLLAARLKRGAGKLPGLPVSGTHDFSTKKPRRTRREMLDFARELDAYIAEKYPDLKSRMVRIYALDMEKTLLTSGGARAYSMTPRALVMVSLSCGGAAPADLSDWWGGFGEFGDRFSSPKWLYPQIDRLYGHLLCKASGIYPQGGIRECILGPELAGILAHEAIGHTVEADLVLGGSVAADKIGKKAASPLVTLVDFAHTALGKTCPVPVYIDDEGIEGRDAVIIEEGMLKTFLHNRESAAHFGAEPMGNARAYQFSDEPLIRMRNTAILPGKSALEEMTASIDDGYYFMKSSNGQADSTSEFMFGVPLGYEIKKGKLGRALRDTTISGVAFDVLGSVSMVSDEFCWTEGMCGKKQPIPVGMGGPAIKCRVNVGGR